MDQNQMQPPQPSLCKMGCGFYGSPTSDGMCSKCHKDSLRRKQNSQVSSGRMSPSAGSQMMTSETQTAPMSSSSSSSIHCDPLSSSSAVTPTSTTVPISCNTTLVASASSPPLLSTTSHIPTDKSPPDSVDNATPPSNDDSGCSTPEQQQSGDDSSSPKSASKPKKNRCSTCKKKVGLTGFHCRCGGLYCSMHRYSDKHECSFDYRAAAQEQIRRNNPVIVGEKIQKL